MVSLGPSHDVTAFAEDIPFHRTSSIQFLTLDSLSFTIDEELCAASPVQRVDLTASCLVGARTVTIVVQEMTTTNFP